MSLCSHNPMFSRDAQGNEIPTTRLTVDGIPVSISGADIEDHLVDLGYKLRSPLQWERSRNPDGELSRYATGRRKVWIDIPSSPLPNVLKIGSVNGVSFGRLFYRERPKTPIVCWHCGLEGHRKNDPICRVSFRGSGSSHGESSDSDAEIEGADCSDAESDNSSISDDSAVSDSSAVTVVAEGNPSISGPQTVSQDNTLNGSGEAEGCVNAQPDAHVNNSSLFISTADDATQSTSAVVPPLPR